MACSTAVSALQVNNTAPSFIILLLLLLETTCLLCLHVADISNEPQMEGASGYDKSMLPFSS